MNFLILQSLAPNKAKVGINFGYYNPTRFQARDTKVQKLMFLFFVLGEFNFYLVLMGYY